MRERVSALDTLYILRIRGTLLHDPTTTLEVKVQIGSIVPLIGDKNIHIIGGGSLGSKVASTLSAMRAPKLHVWDDDTVESRNRFNQRFLAEHVGLRKPDAVADYCSRVSNSVVIPHYEKVHADTPLDGYVFVCVDSMRARKLIWSAAQSSAEVALLVDGRVGMDGGKVFALDPHNVAHQIRYGNPPHMYDGSPETVGGCKTDFPAPYLSDLVAAHMVTRFVEWLEVENSSESPFMNFFGFLFNPYRDAREYWLETGRDS